VLSRKNIAPGFEDLEHKETRVPNLSGTKEVGGGGPKTPSDFTALLGDFALSVCPFFFSLFFFNMIALTTCAP
jgi:hypothetical protein